MKLPLEALRREVTDEEEYVAVDANRNVVHVLTLVKKVNEQAKQIQELEERLIRKINASYDTGKYYDNRL